MIRALAFAALALSACAPMPAKDVYISWSTVCSNGPQVHRVRIVDTPSPVVDCIKAAPAEDAARWTLLTLLGVPPAACTIVWSNGNGSVNHAEMYAALTPPVAAGLAWIGTLQTPEQITIHELEHLYGSRHVLFPFVDRCESGA